MSWLSSLRHRQTELRRDPPRLGLAQRAQREAQVVDLLLRGGEQKIALVAGHVGGREEIAVGRAVAARPAFDIVARGQRRRIEIARPLEKIGEFDRPVAGHARDRRPGQMADAIHRPHLLERVEVST
jgi:hypothetical protein